MGNRATQLKGNTLEQEQSVDITRKTEHPFLNLQSQLLDNLSLDVRMCSNQLNTSTVCDRVPPFPHSIMSDVCISNTDRHQRIADEILASHSTQTSANMLLDASSAQHNVISIKHSNGGFQTSITNCPSDDLSPNAAVTANNKKCLQQLQLISSESEVIDKDAKNNVVSQSYQIRSCDNITDTLSVSPQYIVGKHYSVTAENGTFMKGVYDGKYLVVPDTSCVANSVPVTSSSVRCMMSNVDTSNTISNQSNQATPDAVAKKRISEGKSDALTDCHVQLDRLPRDDYMKIKNQSIKRVKVQLVDELHMKSCSENSLSTIKQKFYDPCSERNNSCDKYQRKRRQRKHLQPLHGPVSVIHIDHDDSDEMDNVSRTKTAFDSLELPYNEHRQYDASCDLLASVDVNIASFKGRDWQCVKALFYQQKVEIDTEESGLLTLELCDILSITLEVSSSANKLSCIRIKVRSSFKPDWLLADQDCNKADLLLYADGINPESVDMLMTAIQIISSLLPENVESSPLVFGLDCHTVAKFKHRDDANEGDIKASFNDKFAVLCRPPLHIDDSRTSLCSTSASLQALHEYDDSDQNDEMTEQDDDVITRCSDAIVVSNCFTGEIVKLFTYPPPPIVGGITVTNEDLFCLNDGEFLNDVIIEFYIKYLNAEKLTSSERERTHIFNTFFYGQLTKECKDSASGHSVQQRRHSQVKRWTKHVDLFSKDFIIIPINEDSHWFLAIICFPYLVGTTGKPSPVMKSPLSSPVLSKVLPGYSSQQAKLSVDSIHNDNKQPCILIFDSLKGGSSRWTVAVILREYLQIEWDLKKSSLEGRRLFEKSSMKGASPGCPQQSNSSDCGIYVLHYIENFFKRPLQDFTLPIRYLNKWFPLSEIETKRHEIRRLIVNYMNKFNPSLNYDPTHDGCEIE